MSLMLPETGLLFWMTLIFAIVFFILAKFGFPIITGMVEQRNKRIEDALTKAAEAENMLARLSQEQELIVDNARKQQDLILQEAVAKRDMMLKQAQDQAKEEAQRIIDEARVRIAEEKDAAMKDVRHQVSVVSMAIAEKVVRRNLESDSSNAQLIDTLFEEASSVTKSN